MIKYKHTVLDIPRETSFDCPEGSYSATLSEVRDKPTLTTTGLATYVRLLFEVITPESRKKMMMAGKNFDPKMEKDKASLLRIYLETWLGPEVFKENAGGQFDLQSLVGRPAEVVLVHICNEKHPKPFVDIQAIHPPGALTLTYTASGDHRRGQ